MKQIRIRIGPPNAPGRTISTSTVTIPLPKRDDALDKAKRDITHLKHEVSRLQSKIRRMKEDLEWEIKGWLEALETGERQESIEGIKRRISRLRGACDFQGVTDFDKADNLSADREL